ncbi:MAG: dodecin [Bryobacteraceae bacterium]|jgi:flavin-binding protein dodecin
MARTYKLVELVGTSNTSFFDAAKAAVAEAAKTLDQMEWFEVVRETGKIQGDQVKEFQVTLKVGCRI